MYNSDKRGITLNLKKKKGHEVLMRLVKASDVFLTNMHYKTLRKMKLDYEVMAEENPKIIYARANGFGFKGPDADILSMDVLGQARAGNMSLLSFPGEEPTYATGGICDQAGAFILAFGVVTALYIREHTGIGQMVETSQLGAMIKLLELPITGYCMAGHPWTNTKRRENKNPLWNWYKCKDERWIVFAHLQSDPYWKDFATLLGLEDLIDDNRFKEHMDREQHFEELTDIVEKAIEQRTSEEWLSALNDYPRISYTFVNNIQDLPSDPQVLANEYLVEVDHPLAGRVKMVGSPLQFSKSPVKHFRFMAPELGQNTEQVLLEVGKFTWDEITQLREDGVI